MQGEDAVAVEKVRAGALLSNNRISRAQVLNRFVRFLQFLNDVAR
jgi:hypothetical protein